MRAPKSIACSEHTTIDASGHSVEALVANLCISSAGLNQNALLPLFGKALREFFGASGACCKLFSRREGWAATYSDGKLPWGPFEKSLPPFHEEMIREIVRTRVTIVRRESNEGETSHAPRPTESIWMAIPFLKGDELLGAALLVLSARSRNFDEKLTSKSTAIGAVMAGLLEHARILNQVEVSRKQWVQVMDTIPDCIVVHDKQKKIIRANSALATRLDTHPINLVGRDIREVVTVNGGDANDSCPLCLRRDDGLTKPVEIFSKRSFLVSTSVMGSGADAQIIHVMIDIHDRLAIEAALHRERDFNESILNNTQNIILVLDTSGRIAYVNRRAEELGSSHSELSGSLLAQIIHTSHRPLFDMALQTVLNGNPAQSLEAPVARPDGRVARFALHLSSIKDGGKVGSVVVVMTDITEASVLQANLARTEKMAALGQLVSGVAHEINNPLAAIVGFADLLCENPAIPAPAREELEAILREAERTRVLVQDLLSFAHDVPPQSEPVQINLLLRQTLKMRSYSLAGRNVEVVEKLSANLPVVVGDPHQLQQVFLNILNNAYDAVDGTGRVGRIEIETVQVGDFVEVRVRDNGPGIANSERIFEPFFTTKPVGKGTGLGLSICYGIVRTHKGEILFQNNSGANNSDKNGCTFAIRLPAAIIRTPIIHEVESGNGIANSSSRR
jgi:PAS domain S-box-containing protein